jgi:hypothetical protein
MYDASNRKDIRRAEKEARQDEIRALDYLIGAMSIPQGRAWFYDLLEACHCFNEVPNWEPYQEMYYKGMRNVGLRVFAQITAHCPDDYILMMKEANARAIERDIRANRDHDARSAASAEYSGSSDAGWDSEGSVDGVGDYNSTADGVGP